ncbi:hypothetical protein [Curtobacterium flaccumfaciens]|uniref:hypothetical protein n=1 Tax=Curtobacterium flaccumfaciens TaxID=2035 RepID=UPI0038791535
MIDNSRAAAIARVVLANADYQTMPSFDALTYGAIAVLNGEADRRGITPRELYDEQVAEAMAQQAEAVAESADRDAAAEIVRKVRGR